VVFKKASNGKWYYFGRGNNTIHVVKCRGNASKFGLLVSRLSTGEELVGKRVRILLEVVEDGDI